MAFFRCGNGNSSEVLIDGVEVDGDVKLEYLGYVRLDGILQVPENKLPYNSNYTQDAYSYCYFAPYKGSFLLISSSNRLSYCADGETWERINLSNFPTSNLSGKSIIWATEIDGILYMLWSSGTSASSSKQLCYLQSDGDVISSSDTYTMVSSMPGPGAVCVHNSDIYLMCYTDKYLYKYSTINKSWTRLKGITTSEIFSDSGTIIIPCDNKIHLFHRGSSSKYYWTYSIESDTWSQIMVGVLSPSDNFVVLNDTIYSILQTDVRMQHLYVFKNGVWTKYSKYSLSGEAFKNFHLMNGEIWYLHCSTAQDDLPKVGKLSEVYSLKKG